MRIPAIIRSLQITADSMDAGESLTPPASKRIRVLSNDLRDILNSPNFPVVPDVHLEVSGLSGAQCFSGCLSKDADELVVKMNIGDKPVRLSFARQKRSNQANAKIVLRVFFDADSAEPSVKLSD